MKLIKTNISFFYWVISGFPMYFAGISAGTAAAVAAAAASAAGAIGSAASKKKGMKGAGAAQDEAFALSKEALEESRKTARGDITTGRDNAINRLNPYARTGRTALDALSQQMGLGGTYQASEAPKQNNWKNSTDPLWAEIARKYNPKKKPWDQGKMPQVLKQAQREWMDRKNQLGTDGQSTDPNAGYLSQQYGMEQYQNDPGYTPMVNSLEELQATPGYQFRYQQGMDATNNSAAAKGSLLSGRQLKAVDQYSQGFASTEYQNAWDRAQQAYQNAFSRDTTNKNNTFNRLSSMAGNGQNAAGQQSNYDFNAGNNLATTETRFGENLAGINTQNGNNKADLALAKGQNQANMWTGVTNAVNQGLGGYAGYSGGGGGGGGIVQNNGIGQSTNGFANPNDMFSTRVMG